MQTRTPDTRAADFAGLILPVGLAGILAAAWVALTIQTGLTYHLAPGLIAAAPGFALAWSLDRPPARLASVLTVLGGLGIVSAGWLVLELRHAVPTATFIEGQPGGVRGEIAAFALLGMVLGTRAMFRAGRNA